MSNELQDSLSRAADDARNSFESRDVMDVVAPATTRVKRHRAAVKAASSLAAIVAIGGVLWSVDLIGGTTAAPPAGVPTPVVSTTGSDSRPDTTAPEDTISADVLVPSATPYSRGTTLAPGMQRALYCEMPTADSVRLSEPTQAQSHAYTVTDCAAETVSTTPIIAIDHIEPVMGAMDGASTFDSITIGWYITNVTDKPLVLDKASVSGALTLDRDGTATDSDATVNGMAIAATALWSNDATQFTVLQNQTNDITLEPGESINGETVWSTNNDPTGALAKIAGGAPCEYTLFVRVPSTDATDPNELLLELRYPTPQTFSLQ